MREIRILGKGPGWSDCPAPTPHIPVWSLTNILVKRTAVTKVFEIHDLVEKFGRVDEGMLHQEAAREAEYQGIPYVVREHWDFLPGLRQEIYPLNEVIEYFGTDFIGCSVDAMVALAIYQGYEFIHFHGMGQQRGGTYDYQLESLNFWIGVCVGKGIGHKIHGWAGLRHDHLLSTIDEMVYGFGIPQKVPPRCKCTLMPHSKQCEISLHFINKEDNNASRSD